ncbi:MAG: PKD domain-containing protein [Chitinophagaceae bacterium]|nr:MAG: PKD domain-containing protein [Chitinophagaceae bacterium]
MKPLLLCFLFFLSFSPVKAQQYTVNGNAQQENCNCYRLTSNANDQSGSVWNNTRIDLNLSFDYNFDVYLGNNDGGADGIAFVLQPISTSVGSLGGGMGYQGISPGIGITLDTYQNSSPDSDPFYDHIAIQRNGDINHASANNLAGPIQASASSVDIEDGVVHKLRIVWDAGTKTLSTYFDGIARLNIVNDLVNTTFGGNPSVYWGFTGATGGLSNLQRFCTALTPAWTFSPTQKRCVGEPIQFMNTSISFTTIAKMYWNFGDGSNIDSVNASPVHSYTAAGTYTVTQRVVGADGCEATNTQSVIVGSKPVAGFQVPAGLCLDNAVTFTDTSRVTVGSINSWYWNLDNAGLTSTQQNPTALYTTAGVKNIKLLVKSLQGCESDTLYKSIDIYARPVIDFTFTDSVCLGSPTNFFGTVVSSSHPISNFAWHLGDTSTFIRTTQNTSYSFSTPGNHTVVFLATSTGDPGCMGVVTKNVYVVDKPRAAIKAFAGCEDVSVVLQDSSYTLDGLPITAWWWDLGNGNFSTQQNPTLIYNAAGPRNIQLVVWNSKGCKSDTLRTSININAKPAVDFSISDSCINNTIQFNGFISNSSGNAAAWYWLLDNPGPSATIQNPTHAYTLPGIKSVRLAAVDFNGCASDTLLKPIKIYDRPTINFSFQDSVCLGTTINFSGSVTASADPVTVWQWTFDGTPGATTQNAQHTYLTPGIHTATLQASSAGYCSGPVVQKNVFIIDKPRAAIKKFLACQGVAAQLGDSSYTLDGLPITAWWWNLGNGQFSTQQNPAVSYTSTGNVNIQLVVWNSKGCKSDTLKTSIKVYGIPTANFSMTAPLCNSNAISFTDGSTADSSLASWNWSTASNTFSILQNPTHLFNAGNNTVSLVVTSSAGCVSAPFTSSFVMKTKPVISMSFNDACKFDTVRFSATESGSSIGIVSWHWNFGDGSLMQNGNPVSHAYNANNAYPVKLYAISSEGCSSDTIRRNINIYGTDAFAGNDVVAAANQPIQLNASGGLSYQWTPSTGLSANNIPNPIATNNVDRVYYLRAFTPEGCESFDTLNIKIYRGPDIYVPGAFTPNGDGRNDLLRPVAVGITTFEYFAVYNRYGQLVFKSSNPTAGWDGRIKGRDQNSGTFVWMVSGTDFRGNKIFKKGSVLLIR